MDYKSIIGKRINSALALREIKQKDLADHLNVKDNVVSYFCSGSRTPNTLQIIEIAKFLNVPTDYLLGLAELPDGNMDLTRASIFSGIPEKTLLHLSEMYKDDIIRYSIDGFIQTNTLKSILEEYFMALSSIDYCNIGGYCLAKGGIRNVIDGINKDCNNISVQSIQNKIITDCKKEYKLFYGEACYQLRKFFDNTTNVANFEKNMEQLSKEIYGYYLICVENNNEIPVDSEGRYINKDICKQILSKLENENIPCDDVRKDFNIFDNRENEEAPDNGNNNPEDK